MSILDVISFVPTEETKTSSALRNFFETLKSYDGILGAWHGNQIEEPTRYHIVTVWRSLGQLHAASKDSYHPSLPTTLPIEGTSLQREIFEVNQYPKAALAAPITEITYMNLAEGRTFEADLKPIIGRFAEIPGSGAKGTCWGESRHVEGTPLILVGWNTVQEHYAAGSIPEYKELVGVALGYVTFQLKHVALEQIFKH